MALRDSPELHEPHAWWANSSTCVMALTPREAAGSRGAQRKRLCQPLSDQEMLPVASFPKAHFSCLDFLKYPQRRGFNQTAIPACSPSGPPLHHKRACALPWITAGGSREEGWEDRDLARGGGTCL